MRLTTALLMISMVCCGAAAAQEANKSTKMYKWTDKDGVVQYSATPIEGTDVTEIEIWRGPKLPPPPPTPLGMRQPLDCNQLSENVRLLESDAQNLQVLENGVPRPLTEEERLPQLEAARFALKNCTAPAAGEAPPK